MKKMMRHLYAILMVVIMIISLVPSTVLAAPGKGSGRGKGKKESQPVITEAPAENSEETDEKIVDESSDVETSEEETATDDEDSAEEIAYRAFTKEIQVDNLLVNIDAPEGAFPEGTTVNASKIDNADVQKAVDSSSDVSGTVVAAVDITFSLNGEEIQPVDGEQVTVSITAENLGIDLNELDVIHIDGSTNEASVVEDVNTNIAEETVCFAANSFSTYALVWTDSEATIHWGVVESGSWNEFDAATLDQSVGSISLRATYTGYSYVDAVYYTEEQTVPDVSSASTGIFINDTLTKVIAEDGTYIWTAEKSQDDASELTIADESHIYVVYEVPETPSTNPSSSGDVEGPTTEKTVTNNNDGTYNIQIDVTAGSNTSTTSTGANIVIVFDNSGSMDDEISTGVSRLDAAQSAVETLVTTLNPGTNDIEMALVYFAAKATKVAFNSGTSETYWTKTGSDITNFVNDLDSDAGGTNWNQALEYAYDIAGTADNDPTYVLFVTDGCPSTNSTTSTKHNHDKTGTTNTNDACYTTALAYAKAIAGTEGTSYSTVWSSGTGKDQERGTITKTGLGCKFYGIYTGTDTSNLLATLVSGAGGSACITATSESDIKNAFQNIAQTIINNLGTSDVSVDDGVTELSSVSASTSGEAGGYSYYRSGGTVTAEDGSTSEKYDSTANGGLGETWTDAPGASYTEENGVVWDLSTLGTVESGVTYTIVFTVWPSQEAYDLLADINNGVIRSDDGTVTTYESADAAYAALSDDIKSQIYKNSAGVYVLRTNTHLNTTYTVDGTTYTDADDAGTNAMDLVAEVISLQKKWPSNMLDSYGAAVYRDENGVEQTANSIVLTITRDDIDYLDVTVSSEDDWLKENIYISCGLMTVDTDLNVSIKEEGYDYTVTEPAEFSYYWDLIADVYHPMVINGTATMLVLDKDATTADNTNTFQIDGKFYTKQEDNSNTLQAYNYRRSNLNLTKKVSTEGGQNGYFTYTVKVEDAFSTDGYVWFSAWDPVAEATVKDTNWVTGGATAETGETGYWYATNGATVTFKIKAGWNVRFLNLYHGSTFSFEETEMPDYYEFETVGAAVKNDFMDEDSENWYEIDSDNTDLITGTIVEPNNSYTITYTNKYEAFYVYHSGADKDGNLEIVAMPEDGDTYDLTQNITKNTLYGGYYLDYAGKGDYNDDGIAGTTGVAYTGMNYDWTGAQTTIGTKITPEAGETYYIKEVPTYYLRNYYQINYMKTSGELKALYLVSAIDDLNYKETGFTLTNGNETAKVVAAMTFRNYSTNRSVTLKANNVFRSLGITGDGSEKDYLTYFDATESDYFATGEFTVLPYWTTPDGITVNGISTRTVTITELTKAGISKSDS